LIRQNAEVDFRSRFLGLSIVTDTKNICSGPFLLTSVFRLFLLLPHRISNAFIHDTTSLGELLIRVTTTHVPTKRTFGSGFHRSSFDTSPFDLVSMPSTLIALCPAASPSIQTVASVRAPPAHAGYKTCARTAALRLYAPCPQLGPTIHHGSLRPRKLSNCIFKAKH
jgi:hypothetical protein